jgi:CheY-like chemotaxis protein
VTRCPVLVVDDDPDGLAVVSLILKLEGHSVLTAAGGAEGLDVARREHPCVILLDLMMPVMDGHAFRAAQLADPAIADIPVLVLSAHADAEVIAIQLGAEGCVPKPVHIDRLLDGIRPFARLSGEPGEGAGEQ